MHYIVYVGAYKWHSQQRSRFRPILNELKFLFEMKHVYGTMSECLFESNCIRLIWRHQLVKMNVSASGKIAHE